MDDEIKARLAKLKRRSPEEYRRLVASAAMEINRRCRVDGIDVEVEFDGCLYDH
jgi:hypothetical protein